MTKYGFYSITQVTQDLYSYRYQVRSRNKQDLINLKELCFLTKVEILENAGTDYEYRIFVNEDDLRLIMIFLSKAINYSNFKDTIMFTESQRYKLLAYHDIWRRMIDVEEETELINKGDRR